MKPRTLKGRPKAALELSHEERRELERLIQAGTSQQQAVLRARVVLLSAQGWTNGEVAQELDLCQHTVGKWRQRFVQYRMAGLGDAPRPKEALRVSDRDVARLLRLTLESKPKGSTHWSSRMMAKQVGLSQATVSRIWRAFRLKPHRRETFTLSTDEQFVEKVHDIVGLYMKPPDHAVVLCVDEKSQIQALERSQPVLPMRPGVAERITPSYLRHGTTTLFAALDVITGRVIGQCHRRHRAKEFVKFLGLLDHAVPKHLQVHLVLDNYATHSTEEVIRWRRRHPRFQFHFTPTYSSWLNQVERWFALLTERQIKRGVHRSTWALERSIREFLDAYNDDPKPFVWTKTAADILASMARYCQLTLDLRLMQRNADSAH